MQSALRLHILHTVARALCGLQISYDYDYGGGFSYTDPQCRRDSVDDITEKEPSRIFVTTQYTETVTVGWPCSHTSHTTKAASCSGVAINDGVQCGCETKQTIYPLGTEEMVVQFTHVRPAPHAPPGMRPSRLCSPVSACRLPHAISPPQRVDRLLRLVCVCVCVCVWRQRYGVDDPSLPHRGDSLLTARSADGVDPLDADFAGVFPNQSKLTVPSGRAIAFRLADWLMMANTSLDEANTAQPTDARAGVQRHPMFRTTGVALQVELEYSNKHRQTNRLDISISVVHARAAVLRQTIWAGLGALPTIYVTYPTESDPHTFHTVRRDGLTQ